MRSEPTVAEAFSCSVQKRVQARDDWSKISSLRRFSIKMNIKFGISNTDDRERRRRSRSVSISGSRSASTSPTVSPGNTGERNSNNEVFFTAHAKINSDASEKHRKEGRSISVPVLMPAPELLRDFESFNVSVDSSSLSSLEELPSTDLCSTEL